MVRITWKSRISDAKGSLMWWPENHRAALGQWAADMNRSCPDIDHWVESDGKEEEKQTLVPGKPVGDSSPSTSD